MNKVKIGVVGLGRLGHQHADNIVNHVRNAQLSAVCSVQGDELALLFHIHLNEYMDESLRNKECY